MAGTVAIAVFTFAYVGKQLYELIETVDMGAYEAMEAMGAGRAQAFLAAIQPQVLPAYLSVCLFCFEGNVRYAAILGYVGAGGLGLILNEKIGWREYEQRGHDPRGIIRNGARDLRHSAIIFVRSLPRRGQGRMKKEIDKMYEQEPKTWYAKILVALIVAALLAWSMSTVQSGTTGGDGLTVAGKIISGIFHPDTALLFNFTTSGVAYLLLETMCIAFLGTIVGAVLSIPLSFLASANLVPKPIALIFRVFIMAIRTIPAFVYGLMFIRVTGPGPFAGLLTMSLCSIGMISKMFIESIEDLDTQDTGIA